MLRFLVVFLVSCLVSTSVYSAIDIYEFATESQRERYHRLVDELRCPKCQNQNLGGSNSQIATDLRRELHRLLLEGKTDSEIKTFMVERYGDFVLYRPPVQGNTLLLWALPVVLLLIGAGVVFVIVRYRQEVRSGADLSTDQKPRLQQLLDEEEAP